MITETLEWYKPEEQMPTAHVDLLGLFTLFSIPMVVECYLDSEEGWIIPTHMSHNPTPTYWCYKPVGPK